MTTKVVGKGGISAEIIAHSVSPHGKEIITFVFEYHRYVHSELMSHRALSRNSSSSRAIPVKTMLQHIQDNPAVPIHWGKNQSGMQAGENIDEPVVLYNDYSYKKEDAWLFAADNALWFSEAFSKAGYHKQIVNRLTEPFQMMRVVVTATEWDNFFWLRFDKDTQPEFAELARCALVAMKHNSPVTLKNGEWHIPFYHEGFWKPNNLLGDSNVDVHGNTLEQALKISLSCCAQTSYRKNDDSLEKAEKVWDKVANGEKFHASVTEHQATPIDHCIPLSDWGIGFGNGKNEQIPKGITHLDANGDLWSNNFKGWIQYRSLIPNNVCTNFDYSQEVDEDGLTIILKGE